MPQNLLRGLLGLKTKEGYSPNAGDQGRGQGACRAADGTASRSTEDKCRPSGGLVAGQSESLNPRSPVVVTGLNRFPGSAAGSSGTLRMVGQNRTQRWDVDPY